jgi:hypothetical protein
MQTDTDSTMQKCPLCEGENHCGMANNEASVGVTCWCMEEDFATAKLKKLQDLPAPARCICQSCLQLTKEITYAG